MAITDDVDRLTNCIQSYQIDDDDITIPDEIEDVRFGGIVTTNTPPIQVKAHVEWQEKMIGHASSNYGWSCNM